MSQYNDILAFSRLKLHVDKPDFEEVWLHGYESAFSDEDELMNPYDPESHEHQLWQDGWWAGFYEEDPLFSLAGEIYPEVKKAPETVAVAQQYHSPIKQRFQTILQIMAALLAGFLLVEAVDLMT